MRIFPINTLQLLLHTRLQFPRLRLALLRGLLPLLAVMLSGCGYLGGLFDDDEEERPAALTDFEEEVEPRRLWRVSVGNGQGDKYNRLTPALVGDTLYVASNDGNVMAVAADTGDQHWRTRLRDEEVTGGVGAGNGLVLVGTVDSTVIALNQDSGERLWESTVASEVLSAPATNGDIVVVQSVDGTLTALDAASGEQRWVYESTVPALSLRGTSSPAIMDGFVLAAFANGTVVSVALDNGTLRWEERVAVPTGRSEIDRMVDIDGEVSTGPGGQLVVPSYQGYLATLNPTTGQTRWRVSESTPMTAGSGFGNVYVSDDRGVVKAYRPGQDETVWTNDQLTLRRLSGPTAIDNYVAVGDFEGYVHLLSQVDGRLVGRTRVDRKGVRARMLVRDRDDTLFVYGNGGTLVALRVE